MSPYSCQVDVSSFKTPEGIESSEVVTLMQKGSQDLEMISKAFTISTDKSFYLRINPIQESGHIQATVMEADESDGNVQTVILFFAMVPQAAFTLVARHDIQGKASKFSTIVCERK